MVHARKGTIASRSRVDSVDEGGSDRSSWAVDAAGQAVTDDHEARVGKVAVIKRRLRSGLKRVTPEWCLRTIWWLKFGGLAVVFRVIPVRRSKIVASSFYGAGYGGGCRYVFDSLLKITSDIDLVWLLRNDVADAGIPQSVRIVRYGSVRALYELATARVWLDDSRKHHAPPKRRSQFYVQLWHGPFGIKQSEGDALEFLDPSYVFYARRDARWTDLMLSSSVWFSEWIRRAYWFDGEIMAGGNPRIDPLLSISESRTRAIKHDLGVSSASKTLLYAPTFRNSRFPYANGTDLSRLAGAAARRWGGDWIVLVRMHPNVAARRGVYDQFIDVSGHKDSQELLYIADLVITDYSSLMYDSMVASVKCMLYVPDAEEYRRERPLYFEFADLPLPHGYSVNELVACIESFDESEYRANVCRFLSELGVCEDGRSAERLASRLVAEIAK